MNPEPFEEIKPMNAPQMPARAGSAARSAVLWRIVLWQGAAIAFGLAVVWSTQRLEWVLWQQILAFFIAKDLMAGAIGLVTPDLRAWAQRVIWRNNRGLSAFWCATHIHPLLVWVFFPCLHDFTFATRLYGMCLISALLLHRCPARFRGQCGATLAGLAALWATQNGVPDGFGWMAFLYPAKVILCWWLPVGSLKPALDMAD